MVHGSRLSVHSSRLLVVFTAYTFFNELISNSNFEKNVIIRIADELYNV